MQAFNRPYVLLPAATVTFVGAAFLLKPISEANLPGLVTQGNGSKQGSFTDPVKGVVIPPDVLTGHDQHAEPAHEASVSDGGEPGVAKWLACSAFASWVIVLACVVMSLVPAFAVASRLFGSLFLAIGCFAGAEASAIYRSYDRSRNR